MSKAPYDSGVIKIFSIVKGYVTALIGNTTAKINAALAGKAAASHSHSQSDVTGLADALAAKADATATQTALNAKQDALTAGDNVSIATVNGVLTISATDTDTTYSAGTGLSLSGTTFSNSAPNVKSDWNAAAGTDAEILNKPTIPNYSNATPSTNGSGGSAGLLSPADKEKLDKMVVISASDYEAFDALNPPDSGTLYFVLEATS